MTLRTKLKSIVEETDTKPGRLFDFFIQSLIVLSLITFSIETIPDLSIAARKILFAVECITVIIFTIEYILRVILADNKLKFVFSFYGLVDLLAIVPFYLPMVVDLRSIRVLRLFRLFRILKLVRYSKAIRRFHVAFKIAKEELILYFCMTMMILYLAAVGIYYCENAAQPKVFSSIFTSLWWAVVTLTTVGYGDAFPITLGGRLFTFLILMLGLGIVAVPAGLVSSALSKAREMEDLSNSIEANEE